MLCRTHLRVDADSDNGAGHVQQPAWQMGPMCPGPVAGRQRLHIVHCNVVAGVCCDEAFTIRTEGQGSQGNRVLQVRHQ